jgi:hypothetical protein
LTNPNSTAAATAKNVAYAIHKQLMENSVSNKLIHLLLNHVKYSYESLKCGTVLRDTLEAQAFVAMHCFLFKLQDQAFSLEVEIPDNVKLLNVFKSYNLVIRHGKVLECESTGLNFAHHLVHMCSYEHMRCVIGRLGMGVIPKANPEMLKIAHATCIKRAKGWCKSNERGGCVFTPNPYGNMMKPPDTHKCTEWPIHSTDRQPMKTDQPVQNQDDPDPSKTTDPTEGGPTEDGPSEDGESMHRRGGGGRWGEPVEGAAAWSGNGDDADVLF